MPAKTALRYTLRLQRQHAHMYDVELDIDEPDPRGQEFWMPVWIPGSYLVREFAKHVVAIDASCSGRPLALDKVAKNRWRAAACDGPLRLRWSVHAHDASVRTAYLDEARAFFNPSSLLLAAQGREHDAHELRIEPPPSPAHWQVATTLPALKVDARGFGVYRARHYDALVDHPVLIGDLLRVPLRAHGTPHELVFDQAGRLQLDRGRLREDIKRVCEATIALFEPGRPRAPFARYAFLTMPSAAGGYGGLEHADCTALICADADLPHPRDGARSAGYRRLLGLCSHEYFHAWNVKRIRPAAPSPPDLERENPSGLLWLFEGFTSYYDDLLLRRAGLIDDAQYLQTLARSIDAVLGAPGRQLQTLRQASYDAWIKYYRPDANSVNATVSYYTQGALFALTLDLTLRSRGAATLDDVMRALWRRHGATGSAGVAEHELPALVREVSGLDLRRLFARHVDGCAELPLRRLLAAFGVGWSHGEADALASLGLKLDDAQGWPLVRQVLSDSWAQRAGLAAGDLLIAIDGERASVEALRRRHARARAGEVWQVHLMRDARLLERSAPLAAPAPGPVQLTAAPRASAAALHRRRAWLDGTPSTEATKETR
jgi:predicted metalloprotease with PDZ domain